MNADPENKPESEVKPCPSNVQSAAATINLELRALQAGSDAADPSSSNPTGAAATPEPSRRKHLVESAGYWFKAGRQAQNEGKSREAINGFENAYNHVENALAASRDETIVLRREVEIAKSEAESFRKSGIAQWGEFRQQIEKLTTERDTAQADCAALREALQRLYRVFRAIALGENPHEKDTCWAEYNYELEGIVRQILSSPHPGSELLADRERLTWLDENCKPGNLEEPYWKIYARDANDLRSAIDAARKPQP